MSGLIQSICTELLDGLVKQGRCEFVRDFARVVPARLFFRWMRLPMERADEMGALVHGLTARDTHLSPRAAALELHLFLHKQVTDREAERGDDLISAFFNAVVDGRSPTVDEVYKITYLVLIAGLDTTSGVLSFIFRHLAQQADQRQWILDDFSRLPESIAELTRRYPISNNVRRVRCDQTFAGLTLKTDDLLLLPLTLANSDRAADLALDGEQRLNLAFGGGVHRCLGSHLAQLEMTTAAQAWHERIPNYWIDGPMEDSGYGGPIMGLHRLPLAWNTDLE
jgi:cytochrome P450